MGIDIREETNQENIAYHRVWFTVEHVGSMGCTPPDAPTPSTVGAVDLDPWIPKPSTREIVDHLVQEINAAKQIAEEIGSVQSVLDGMIAGTKDDDGLVQRVQKELEEKTRRVEELEGLLGLEREERRALEEKIRMMQDERATKLEILLTPEPEQEPEDPKEEVNDPKPEESAETLRPEPILPNGVHTEPIIEITSPPTTPSTTPSSPKDSTRSISPISLPSTESSNPETAHLLDKISHLESQLALATAQIEDFKIKLQATSPILNAVSNGVANGMASSIDYPFTFTIPSTPSPRRSKSVGSLRRRPKHNSENTITKPNKSKDLRRDYNRELMEGLCAAVGVVVLGWVGMYFINHLVERGDKVVK